jgi:hypothetical protein
MRSETAATTFEWPLWPIALGVLVTALTGACYAFAIGHDKLRAAFGADGISWFDQQHLTDLAAMIGFNGLWIGAPLMAIGGFVALLRLMQNSRH